MCQRFRKIKRKVIFPLYHEPVVMMRKVLYFLVSGFEQSFSGFQEKSGLLFHAYDSIEKKA